MNPEMLAKLQKRAQVGQSGQLGGKGTARRKKKIIHRTATTDDKKLQNSLKKLTVNPIPGIEEVNMIKDDGTVIHFNNPKVQASLASNTFAVSGHAEQKKITEMVPGILNQLRAENFAHLTKLLPGGGAGGLGGLSSALGGGGSGGDHPKQQPIAEEDEDVPDMVDNFDEIAKSDN